MKKYINPLIPITLENIISWIIPINIPKKAPLYLPLKIEKHTNTIRAKFGITPKIEKYFKTVDCIIKTKIEIKIKYKAFNSITPLFIYYL